MKQKIFFLSIFILSSVLAYHVCLCQENRLLRRSELNARSLDTSKTEILWIKELATHAYSGSCFANDAIIDNYGNSYITGKLKINSSGTNEWTRSYQHHGSHFYKTKIVVDKDGTITSCVPDFSYITGLFRLIVVQYSPIGIERWHKVIDSCAHISKTLTDNEKNVYLISEYGYSKSNSVIIKFDSTGKIQWKKPMQPMIYDAIIDSYGGLVVTGGTSRNFDSWFYVGKIDRQGDLVWQDQDTIPTATSGRALVEDYLGGFCISALTVNGASNIIVFRYDSLGHRSWSYTYDGFSTDISTTTHISVSKTNDVFVGAITWYN